MVGSQCIKSWSKTQAVVAKSSAESELCGVVKAACETLGLFALAADLGEVFEGRIMMDASAAMGIINRHGVGKLRHLHCGFLWVQEAWANKVLEFNKKMSVNIF